MIDTESETLISLSQAARQVMPSRPVHISTVYRWVQSGARGHRLEAIHVGGRTLTSREALGRFLRALNSDRPQTVPEPHNARADRAGRELAAKGC